MDKDSKMRQVCIYVHVICVNLHQCIFLFLCMHLAARKQQFSHICNSLCVCVYSPVSLQLSAVLSEGRPQVPGVPRGVVAHSSGSRNHDAFCRHTQKKLEVERWNATTSLEACGHYSDTQRRQLERRKCGGKGLSHTPGSWHHLTCSDRLEQDPVKSSMSDLEPPSRSSRMRSVGILPFRQVM